MCVKINVLYVQCTLYSVHIAYIIYAQYAISPFIYPRRTNAFCAHQ